MTEKKAHKAEALRKRIQELEFTIQDIERRRLTDPNREHPSQNYINGLKFDLRGFRADLERLTRGTKEKADEVDPTRPSNVVRLFEVEP